MLSALVAEAMKSFYKTQAESSAEVTKPTTTKPLAQHTEAQQATTAKPEQPAPTTPSMPDAPPPQPSVTKADDSIVDIVKSLPPNWDCRVEKKTGRLYYVNHVTKTCTWTRPLPIKRTEVGGSPNTSIPATAPSSTTITHTPKPQPASSAPAPLRAHSTTPQTQTRTPTYTHPTHAATTRSGLANAQPKPAAATTTSNTTQGSHAPTYTHRAPTAGPKPVPTTANPASTTMRGSHARVYTHHAVTGAPILVSKPVQLQPTAADVEAVSSEPPVDLALVGLQNRQRLQSIQRQQQEQKLQRSLERPTSVGESSKETTRAADEVTTKPSKFITRPVVARAGVPRVPVPDPALRPFAVASTSRPTLKDVLKAKQEASKLEPVPEEDPPGYFEFHDVDGKGDDEPPAYEEFADLPTTPPPSYDEAADIPSSPPPGYEAGSPEKPPPASKAPAREVRKRKWGATLLPWGQAEMQEFCQSEGIEPEGVFERFCRGQFRAHNSVPLEDCKAQWQFLSPKEKSDWLQEQPKVVAIAKAKYFAVLQRQRPGLDKPGMQAQWAALPYLQKQAYLEDAEAQWESIDRPAKRQKTVFF